MTRKPILFLNVDGVLTSARTYLSERRGRPEKLLDPVAVALLSELVRRADLTLVIASMWARRFPQPADWEQLFAAEFGTHIPVSEVIKLEDYHANRCAAIQSVLARYDNPVHVVLEDDELQSRFDMNRLTVIRTDSRVGFGVENLTDVLAIVAPDCRLMRDAQALQRSFFS